MIDLLAYAKTHQVPIIEQEGLEFILDLIHSNNVKSMLEVGTAIGYSGSNFLLSKEDLELTSLERNKEWFDVATEVMNEHGLNSRAHLVFGDALDFVPTAKYDLIFIDAAKAQYKRFFEKFAPYLNPGGLIVCDNLEFHGLVEHPEQIESRNLRALVRKIGDFVTFLKEETSFETTFHSCGDGISVSKKK